MSETSDRVAELPQASAVPIGPGRAGEPGQAEIAGIKGALDLQPWGQCTASVVSEYPWVVARILVNSVEL